MCLKKNSLFIVIVLVLGFGGGAENFLVKGQGSKEQAQNCFSSEALLQSVRR